MQKTMEILNRQIIACYGFEPGACKRLNVESRFYNETAPTLRNNAGDNQTSAVIIYDNTD